MNSQKQDTLLSLAMDSTKEEREQSRILDVGIDETSSRWEVIVKYHGNIERIANEEIWVETLIAGYAIVTLPAFLLSALADLEEVEYIEKYLKKKDNYSHWEGTSFSKPTFYRESLYFFNTQYKTYNKYMCLEDSVDEEFVIVNNQCIKKDIANEAMKNQIDEGFTICEDGIFAKLEDFVWLIQNKGEKE
mgnify:CR=1 FL=1